MYLSIFSDIGDTIKGAFSSLWDSITGAISRFFGRLFYTVIKVLCYLLKVVNSFFEVFSGSRTVEYDGNDQYLINVFFGNKSINNVYWGMALIGIIFVIVMALIAVIKKMFDAAGKQQKTMGSIIMSGLKSILTILLLSAVMSAVLNITNLLVDRVTYIFDNADSLELEDEHVFTDEEFATMARIYNTIGNYSLNPSYNSRFNLNSCYNDIRPDLMLLQEAKIFKFYYDESKEGVTWQSKLQKLVRIADPQYEQPIDAFTPASSAILDIMTELKTNSAFYPLASVKRTEVRNGSETVGLDRVIFLMGTLDSAKNSAYNIDPYITDPVRGPFYYGQQDIYDFDEVSDSFDISISGISYLMIGIMAWITLKNLTICIFNCIARIFNLLGLYIIAPPLIAITPLDDGEKFKQWITSTVVQMFGVFGSIIPMRLVIMFTPMVLDNKLKLFPDSGILNILGKAILILGSIEAANKFSGIVTGILANSAGMAAVNAGDMSGYANKAFGATFGRAARGVSDVTGATALGNKLSGMYDTMRDKGGLILGSYKGIKDYNKSKRLEAVNDLKLKNDEQALGITKPKQSSLPSAGNFGVSLNNNSSSSGGNKPLPPKINKP